MPHTIAASIVASLTIEHHGLTLQGSAHFMIRALMCSISSLFRPSSLKLTLFPANPTARNTSSHAKHPLHPGVRAYNNTPHLGISPAGHMTSHGMLYTKTRQVVCVANVDCPLLSYSLRIPGWCNKLLTQHVISLRLSLYTSLYRYQVMCRLSSPFLFIRRVFFFPYLACLLKHPALILPRRTSGIGPSSRGTAASWLSASQSATGYRSSRFRVFPRR